MLQLKSDAKTLSAAVRSQQAQSIQSIDAISLTREASGQRLHARRLEPN